MERPVDLRILGSHVKGDKNSFLSVAPYSEVDGDNKSKLLNIALFEGVEGKLSQFFGIHIVCAATHLAGVSFALGNMAHKRQSGFNVGLFNECDGYQSGFTFGVHSLVRGNQSGAVFNAFNLVEQTMKGAVFSLYTHIEEELRGFAAGLCVNVQRFKGFIFSPVTLIKDAENSTGRILGLVIIRLDKDNWRDRLRFLFMRCISPKEEEPPGHSQQSLQEPTTRVA
ncbi:MAG: hypothetical protein PHS02_04200 [Candidatus ainarchaeum sp.]|nr:hypothetical protein [Candidatus ainarchaeum sp.]